MEVSFVSARWRIFDIVPRTRKALVYGVAAFSIADAAVHLSVSHEHFREWWGYGAFFVIVAMLQATFGLVMLRRGARDLVVYGILGNLGLLGLYIITRTAGVPVFGPHAGHTEEMGYVDLLSKGLEVGTIFALFGLLKVRLRPYTYAAERGLTSTRLTSLVARALRHPLFKLLMGSLVILALLVAGYRFGTGVHLGGQGGTVSASDAQWCARNKCDMHFSATLATASYAQRLGIWEEIEPRLRTSQPFVVTATTHSGTVRGISLDEEIFLSQEGVLYPAAGKPLAVGSHHNTYLIFFPKYDMQGRPMFQQETGRFDLVVREAGVALPAEERLLAFRYPLPPTGPSASFPLSQVLMTLGAAMAALLFACTPCLVGSMAVGTLTTGTAAGSRRSVPLERVKAALARQTAVYLAALVITYLAVAVAVNVLKLGAEHLRLAEFGGGLVLLVIGLWLIAALTPLARPQDAVVKVLRAMVSPLRRRDNQGDADVLLGGNGSSAMGASLAMVCSVAGAPTLSTAILLPLLVYAGLSHPVWAFLMLFVYLVVCAVPFFLVSVGWGELLLRASMRVRRVLLAGSALVLVALGLLLVVSPSAVADTVSTPARFILLPLRWLQ